MILYNLIHNPIQELIIIRNLTMDYEMISSMPLNSKFFPERFELNDDYNSCNFESTFIV